MRDGQKRKRESHSVRFVGLWEKREGKKAQEISGEIEEKNLDFTSFMENTVMTGCFGLLADFSNQIII